MNKRVMPIIDVLLKQDTYITIDAISEMMNVSNKTIRNDLQLVGEWLQENHMKLIKKTGMGVKIEGSIEDKLHVLETVKDRNKAIVDFSPQARMQYIGMQLAIFDRCRIYELSTQLFVSRATIHKDILNLMEEMKRFNLQLYRKNNNGISMQGKEKNIRNFLLYLMLNDNGYHTLIQMIQNPHTPCDGSLVFPGLEVCDDEIKEFTNCIVSSNMQYIKSLNFQSLVLLILRAFCAYIRMQDHHIIHLSEPFLKDLESEPFYREARSLSDRIGNHYHFQFPEVEIRYLQVYCLALQSTKQMNNEDKQLAKTICDQLIQSWSEQLLLPFQKDVELYQNLYEHICPAITRFRHGIPNENPMIEEIHHLYENTFQVVKNSISCIEEHFKNHVSEEEIAYIALHLAASIEQMKQPLTAILVCHNGIGATNLAYSKLCAQIPELKIISKEDYFSIYHADLQDVDVIISTIQLNLPNTIPILQINSILHEYDFQRLKNAVRDLYKKKNDPLNHKMALCS